MQLLVSVRNATEAIDALEGGASIIDVKEPARGSLGAADPACWREVLQVVGQRAPVSIALGELLDSELDQYLEMIPPVQYAKVGLAGCAQDCGWSQRLQDLVSRLPRGTSPVAVAYADWTTCRAPSPNQVMEAARQFGCPALLCDTHDKQHGGLMDYLDIPTLVTLSDSARRAGMLFALAGSLDLQQLPSLQSLQMDYIAVRGAACDGGRLGTVRRDKVREMVQHLSLLCP